MSSPDLNSPIGTSWSCGVQGGGENCRLQVPTVCYTEWGVAPGQCFRQVSSPVHETTESVLLTLGFFFGPKAGQVQVSVCRPTGRSPTASYCAIFPPLLFIPFCDMKLMKSPVSLQWTAAAKSLQSCPTLCNPIDGSPPGSRSLGFSRREHWSGLPFPSPMHGSEK